eukprot:COSAG03_NODE_20671_length_315_cov_1.407407_1_plen_52_part_10
MLCVLCARARARVWYVCARARVCLCGVQGTLGTASPSRSRSPSLRTLDTTTA